MGQRRIALVVWIGLASAGAASASALTFEDRVRAQEAIERVSYAHQIGVSMPFEEAVPREVLERKVRTYLEQSSALERYWHTPVTAEMLSREVERMARETRMPQRLTELFTALGNDRLLVEECLARATLVERLTRSFFGFDGRIHAPARERAERLREELARGAIAPGDEHPLRSVVELRRVEPEADTQARREPADDARPRPLELSTERYDRVRARVPAVPGVVGPVAEERESFAVRVVLEEDEAQGRVRLATFVVEKRSWDDWWAEARSGLDAVAAVAEPGGALPALAGAGGPAPCEPSDTWITSSVLDEVGIAHSAQVWTGSKMIVCDADRGGDGAVRGIVPAGVSAVRSRRQSRDRDLEARDPRRVRRRHRDTSSPER